MAFVKSLPLAFIYIAVLVRGTIGADTYFHHVDLIRAYFTVRNRNEFVLFHSLDTSLEIQASLSAVQRLDLVEFSVVNIALLQNATTIATLILHIAKYDKLIWS